MELSNYLYLITGASRGIGKSISRIILNRGGSVIGVGRSQENMSKTAEEFGRNNSFYPEIRDLSEDIDELPSWIASLVEKYGRLKGMVLSAGIQQTKPLQVIKNEKDKVIFDINYFSNISLIKGFSKMKNHTDNSSIVAISSIAAKVGIPGIISYSASKGALISAIRSAAIELARNKIRINTVSAGHVMTELITGESNFFNKEYLEKLEAKYPLGLGQPEDVANLVCFLLSDEARWITGGDYVIDGGASINF
jgi:NAD(P)-dependent dehydrogenase (short-subunit alcohol dehydrogenase family)